MGSSSVPSRNLISSSDKTNGQKNVLRHALPIVVRLLTTPGVLHAPPPRVWSVKTRRVPSRHCRDARVYGHATTAMDDIECTPPAGAPYTPPPLAKGH